MLGIESRIGTTHYMSRKRSENVPNDCASSRCCRMHKAQPGIQVSLAVGQHNMSSPKLVKSQKHKFICRTKHRQNRCYMSRHRSNNKSEHTSMRAPYGLFNEISKMWKAKKKKKLQKLCHIACEILFKWLFVLSLTVLSAKHEREERDHQVEPPPLNIKDYKDWRLDANGDDDHHA